MKSTLLRIVLSLTLLSPGITNAMDDSEVIEARRQAALQAINDSEAEDRAAIEARREAAMRDINDNAATIDDDDIRSATNSDASLRSVPSGELAESDGNSVSVTTLRPVTPTGGAAASSSAPAPRAVSPAATTDLPKVTDSGSVADDAPYEHIDYAWPSDRAQFRCYAEKIEAAICHADSKDDSHRRDAIAIRCWAESLENQSDATHHFITVPKKALDAALKRLNELAGIYLKTNEPIPVTAETNYTNPKGMGIIDIFTEELSLSTPAAAAASATAAASSDTPPALPAAPARIDTPALPTVTIEHSEFFNLMDHPEFVVVQDTKALSDYVNALKTIVIQKAHGTWNAGKTTELTDIPDVQIVYGWVDKLHRATNSAAGSSILIPKAHFEQIMSKLKALVEQYAQASISIKVDISLNDPNLNNIIFDSGISTDDAPPAVPTRPAPTGEDDDGAAPALPESPSPAHRGDDSSSICSNSSDSSENQQQNCEFLPSVYVKELAQCAQKVQDAIGNKITTTPEKDAHLLPAKIENDFDDATEITQWAQALDTIVQSNTDKKIVIPSEALRKAIQRLKVLAGHYAPKSFSDDSFATEPLRYDPANSTGMRIFKQEINFTVESSKNDDDGNSSTESYHSSDEDITATAPTGTGAASSAGITPSNAAAATASTETEEYVDILNFESFVAYAEQVKTDMQTKLGDLSRARIAAQVEIDTQDIEQICNWINAWDENGSPAACKVTVDTVLARLRQLATTYSSKYLNIAIVRVDESKRVFKQPISLAGALPSTAPLATHILPLDDDEDTRSASTTTAPAAASANVRTDDDDGDVAEHSSSNPTTHTASLHAEDFAEFNIGTFEADALAIQRTIAASMRTSFAADNPQLSTDYALATEIVTWLNTLKNNHPKDGNIIRIPQDYVYEVRLRINKLHGLARTYSESRELPKAAISGDNDDDHSSCSSHGDRDADDDDKGPAAARARVVLPNARAASRTGGTPGTGKAPLKSWSFKDQAIKLITNKFVLAGGAAAAVYYWFYYMDDSATSFEGEDTTPVSAAKSTHKSKPLEAF
jgi:hypothetical protein